MKWIAAACLWFSSFFEKGFVSRVNRRLLICQAPFFLPHHVSKLQCPNMKTYIIRYASNNFAKVQADSLVIGTNTAGLTLQGGAVKAVFPLEHIAGIVEVDEKEAAAFIQKQTLPA